jgi:hypothetical protein
MIYGLIFECPFQEELDNCPFYGIRKLSLKERVYCIMKLSEDKKTKLIRHHELCLKRRESV